MAAQTYAQIYARLDVKLDDASNVTYTQAQKEEFLNTAWNDPYVCKVARDVSLSTDGGADYAMPSGFTEIFDLLIDINGDDFPLPVSRDGYDIIDGTIYLSRRYKGLASSKEMWIYGLKKLTTSDSLPDLVQDYVLELAQIEALEWLKSKGATRFLKNDMTMSELIQAIGTHKARAQELRQSIANQRVITL